MELENIQNEIITQFIKKTDEKLMEFITPYLRIAGIKGEITKGKIKWRGIKMKVHSDFNSTKYQLNQRGIDISPIFEIKNELNKQD
jgi:hypothetical protein